MRKRNISFIADKLLWFIILILPLLFAMVFTCASMNNYSLSVEDSSSFVVLDYVTENNELKFSSIYPDKLYSSTFNLILNPFDSLSCDFDDDDGEIRTYVKRIDILSYNISTRYFYIYVSCFISYTDGVDSYCSVTAYKDGTFVVSYDYYDFTYVEDLNNQLFVSFNPDTFICSCYFGSYNLLNTSYYKGIILDGFTYSSNIFNTYFNNLNYSLDSWFSFGERDIVYNAFNSIFGSQSNIMPIFVEGSFIPKYLTYMAWIYVLHLAFDFLVFIPRLAHKWMGGVYKDEDS